MAYSENLMSDKKVANRQDKCMQMLVRMLWESCEKDVRKSRESCEKVVRMLWGSCEKVVRILWENCEKVVRKFWESCEKVERKSWESCEKVVSKSTTLLQLQTLADMFVPVCSHPTSQKLDVPPLNRRPHDHGFAFQAKGHGKKNMWEGVSTSVTHGWKKRSSRKTILGLL